MRMLIPCYSLLLVDLLMAHYRIARRMTDDEERGGESVSVIRDSLDLWMSATS